MDTWTPRRTWDQPAAAGRSLRLTVVTLLALLVALVAAGPASAHTQLVDSNPKQGAALDAAPTQIVLTFNEVPASVVSVKAQSTNDGPLVALGDPVLDGQTVTVSWPAGTPGDLYRVGYQIVSDDGDPVEGTLIFSYPAAPGDQAAAAPAASTDTGSMTSSVWLVGVGLVAAIAVGLLVVTRRRVASDPLTVDGADGVDVEDTQTTEV
ncbi:MAG: LPXTG cell wall anchor domain-containing protein [Frankiales bacterium]|nr:LPXTG cell wall anchor domain-containing protein [Frankiales bacterium]